MEKILLIERDAQVAKTIMSFFDNTVSLTHLDQPDDIIRHLREGAWDLIITDISLPELNDFNVIQVAKEFDPDTSVLILTDNQKLDFVLSALQNHADALEFKPVEKNKLLEAANNLIQASKRRRAKDVKIVLAIGAHPDDVEIGCGGTLALHRSKGDVINILTLTLGGIGGDPEVRKAEAEEAAKKQGANLFLKNLRDTKITEGVKTIQLIEEAIEVLKPTHIYTHSAHDMHKDHRNVHLATLPAARQVSNICCYQSPSSSVNFKPNLFIEIYGEFLDKKLEALACFKSQCESRPYLRPDIIWANARYWGRFASYGLVEPMEVIKQNMHSI